MSRKFYVTGFALALLAGWLGGAASQRFAPASARVEASAQEGGGGKVWEYCAITRAGLAPSTRRSFYSISYFRPGGVRVVDVDEGASERAAMTKAIARLGEEGWELVGEAPLEFKAGVGEKALYFKRPRP